jgi:serpin B
MMRRMSRACDRRLLAISLGLLGFALPAASAARASAAHRTHPARQARAPLGRPTALSPAATTGALSLDLLHTLGSGNLVFSPDSIATGLAMVGTGAAGETETQIQSALHLSSPAALSGIGALQKELAAEQTTAADGDPEAPALDVADGLFWQSGFFVRPSFLAQLANGFFVKPFFQAGPIPGFSDSFQKLNFEHENHEAVRTIDAWVSARTQGHVTQLLRSLEPSTRLVLASATYLRADWLAPFSREKTAHAPFYARGRSSNVPFLNKTESLPYAHGSRWTAIELPYRASTLSLLIVLPTGSSLAGLERRLDPELLTRIGLSLHQAEVSLSIPRIHLALHTSLDDALKALGVTDAFTHQADFSGMVLARKDGVVPLKIGGVEHSAILRIDEVGTLAAAATGPGVGVTIRGRTSLLSRPHPALVRFDADRPFLFFLRDDRTGAVLFAGRVLNAATAQG